MCSSDLEELEKEEKWEEARVILYDLWSADKDNLDFFMRLSADISERMAFVPCFLKTST